MFKFAYEFFELVVGLIVAFVLFIVSVHCGLLAVVCCLIGVVICVCLSEVWCYVGWLGGVAGCLRCVVLFECLLRVLFYSCLLCWVFIVIDAFEFGCGVI